MSAFQQVNYDFQQQMCCTYVIKYGIVVEEANIGPRSRKNQARKAKAVDLEKATPTSTPLGGDSLFKNKIVTYIFFCDKTR